MFVFLAQAMAIIFAERGGWLVVKTGDEINHVSPAWNNHTPSVALLERLASADLRALLGRSGVNPPMKNTIASLALDVIKYWDSIIISRPVVVALAPRG